MIPGRELTHGDQVQDIFGIGHMVTLATWRRHYEGEAVNEWAKEQMGGGRTCGSRQIADKCEPNDISFVIFQKHHAVEKKHSNRSRLVLLGCKHLCIRYPEVVHIKCR